MPIAALDLGSRRIGVAVTDAASMGAYPVGIVERRALKKDIKAIAAMLGDRRVGTFVIGLPINMDGSEGPAAVPRGNSPRTWRLSCTSTSRCSTSG